MLDGSRGGISAYSVESAMGSVEESLVGVDESVVAAGISKDASSFQVSLFTEASLGSIFGSSDKVSKRIFICSLIISKESVEEDDVPIIIGTSIYAMTYCG